MDTPHFTLSPQGHLVAYTFGVTEREFLALVSDADLADALATMARGVLCVVMFGDDQLIGLR